MTANGNLNLLSSIWVEDDYELFEFLRTYTFFIFSYNRLIKFAKDFKQLESIAPNHQSNIIIVLYYNTILNIIKIIIRKPEEKRATSECHH